MVSAEQAATEFTQQAKLESVNRQARETPQPGRDLGVQYGLHSLKCKLGVSGQLKRGMPVTLRDCEVRESSAHFSSLDEDVRALLFHPALLRRLRAILISLSAPPRSIAPVSFRFKS